MSLPIEDVVEELVALLGLTTVAMIGGVGETRAVTQWTNGRSPQRPNVLRFTLQIASMILNEKDPDIARAWFHGSNPHLGDRGTGGGVTARRTLSRSPGRNHGRGASVRGPLIASCGSRSVAGPHQVVSDGTFD